MNKDRIAILHGLCRLYYGGLPASKSDFVKRFPDRLSSLSGNLCLFLCLLQFFRQLREAGFKGKMPV